MFLYVQPLPTGFLNQPSQILLQLSKIQEITRATRTCSTRQSSTDKPATNDSTICFFREPIDVAKKNLSNFPVDCFV